MRLPVSDRFEFLNSTLMFEFITNQADLSFSPVPPSSNWSIFMYNINT
jgi:hypothetical protein